MNVLERRNFKKGDLIIIGTFVLFFIISTMLVLKAPTGYESSEFSGQVGDDISIQHISKNPPTNYEHEGANLNEKTKENQHQYNVVKPLKKKPKKPKSVIPLEKKKPSQQVKEKKPVEVESIKLKKQKKIQQKPKKIQKIPKKIEPEPNVDETDETDPFPEEN
jgi:hypothetical protein